MRLERSLTVMGRQGADKGGREASGRRFSDFSEGGPCGLDQGGGGEGRERNIDGAERPGLGLRWSPRDFSKGKGQEHTLGRGGSRLWVCVTAHGAHGCRGDAGCGQEFWYLPHVHEKTKQKWGARWKWQWEVGCQVPGCWGAVRWSAAPSHASSETNCR